MKLPQLTDRGRAGSMLMYTMGEPIVDITDRYFTHEIWKMRHGEAIPDMPLDVQIELVNRCNMWCVACPIHSNSRVRSTLDWKTLTRIADEAAAEGVCYFTICGIGEPSLHRDLFRFLRYVRDLEVEPMGLRTLHMMPTVLVSNAMWSPRQLQECIDHPPDLLSVSLAGFSDSEIIERRGGIDLDKFVHNVRTLYRERHVRRREDGGVSPVIHVATHVHPREMEDEQRRLDFINRWLEIADAVIVKPTMLDEHYQNIEAFTGASRLAYTQLSDTQFVRTAPCFETSRRLALDSDGNVWCGHHNSEDFGAHLGSVKTMTLREIWHGRLHNQFRREVRAGVFHRRGCQQCGGEIRDFHRDPAVTMEEKLHFAARQRS